MSQSITSFWFLGRGQNLPFFQFITLSCSLPQHPPSWLPILEALSYPCVLHPCSCDVSMDRSPAGWGALSSRQGQLAAGIPGSSVPPALLSLAASHSELLCSSLVSFWTWHSSAAGSGSRGNRAELSDPFWNTKLRLLLLRVEQESLLHTPESASWEDFLSTFVSFWFFFPPLSEKFSKRERQLK